MGWCNGLQLHGVSDYRRNTESGRQWKRPPERSSPTPFCKPSHGSPLGSDGLEIFGEGERAFRTAIAGSESISRVGGTIGSANSLAMYLNF